MDRWSITIMGTDINTQHLEKARAGIYSEWAFRETRAKQTRARFFAQHDNLYELLPEIRRSVVFRRLNLAEDIYPAYETNTMFMDLILCRNVTIYFPEAVTQMVVNRFYNALVDGGYLVIGHSEYSLNTYKQFHSRTFPDAMLYQRLWETPGSKESPAGGQPKRVTLRPATLPETALTNPPSQPAPPAEPADAKKPNDFEQAQIWMHAGRVDQARDTLLRWLAQHPGHGLACTLLGKVYANLGNWQEANRWCQIAINLDRLNLEAYYTLALIYQHQGQFDQALELMKKVVYIDRNDILGHFSLANLCYSRGQTTQALKSLENSRKLLEARPLDDLVPRSEDITVGRLAQTVVELQQLWVKETGKSALR
jgi:chemotaxis protein methyltransferase CheR